MKPPVNITYGGKRPATEEAQPASVPSMPNAPQNPAQGIFGADANSNRETVTPLPPADVTRMERLTSRLVAQSRDAWLRGLLDQASYAAWLDVASNTQLRIAQHQEDNRGTVRILREQVNLWNEATTQLEQFDQPASHGWKADLSHARVMALRAKFRYSVATTGRDIGPLDQRAYETLAREHFELRRLEFLSRRGTAADFLMAARMADEQFVMPDQKSSVEYPQTVPLSSFQIDQPITLRRSISEVQEPVYLLAFPVVIEANDPFADIVATERAIQFAQFLETPAENREPQQLLRLLGQNAEEVAVEQFARYEIGTATPGQMLQQWWQFESLADTLTDEAADSAFADAQTQRLEQIHERAVSIQDLRGRNAADVTAVQTLWEVRQLKLQSLRVSPEKPTTPPEPASASVIIFGQNRSAKNTD